MNTSEHSHEQEHDNEGDAEDHHGDHEHLIFTKFQLWNQLSSTLLLIVVMLLGSVANVFVSYCIYKKRIGTKYVNPVLLAISFKNIIAISTCVPLAIVMLNFPSTILRLSCDIQENITFIILFAGFLFPALLSVVQCDHITRPQKHLIGGNRIIYVLSFVSAVSVLMGIQSKLSRDEHGCHLWSIITDEVVLTYIYSIALIVLFTLATMVTSYVMIYYQARARQAAVQASILQTGNAVEGASAGTLTNGAKSEPAEIAVLPSIRRKMTTAILKPMFCIVISNIMTSFPWIIVYAFTVYDEIENSSHYAEVRILTMSIMYLPIASDPIIFLAFSTKGRKAIRAILKRNWNTVVPYPVTATVTRAGVTTIQANRDI
ncbi:uncharacterized protein LOC123523348 isoform X2 [Mercenaria mercenaria]|uniref:uncharacterized protein LOC123523348 isoform X2 n=1 Tax=Mercenaria mercenaria TaxID=6596 RepID=UPI00234F1573|nr:uncharacterized protein LOC123523348 isoform X2 [Mercenaria mercenaria]